MTGSSAAATSASVTQKLFPAEYYENFVSKGLRPDGRSLDEARKVTVATAVIRTAHASSSVRIGHAFAIAGIYLELDTPSEEDPDLGIVSVSVRPLATQSIGTRVCRPAAAHLVCLPRATIDDCHHPNNFQDVQATVANVAAVEGRGKDATALGQAVSHLLEAHMGHSEVLDRRQLCVVKGKHCWHLKLDVYVLNSDGALVDLCTACSTTALASLQVRGPLLLLTMYHPCFWCLRGSEA